jgi:hypothetical protein
MISIICRLFRSVSRAKESTGVSASSSIVPLSLLYGTSAPLWAEAGAPITASHENSHNAGRPARVTRASPYPPLCDHPFCVSRANIWADETESLRYDQDWVDLQSVLLGAPHEPFVFPATTTPGDLNGVGRNKHICFALAGLSRARSGPWPTRVRAVVPHAAPARRPLTLSTPPSAAAQRKRRRSGAERRKSFHIGGSPLARVGWIEHGIHMVVAIGVSPQVPETARPAAKVLTFKVFSFLLSGGADLFLPLAFHHATSECVWRPHGFS